MILDTEQEDEQDLKREEKYQRLPKELHIV